MVLLKRACGAYAAASGVHTVHGRPSDIRKT